MLTLKKGMLRGNGIRISFASLIPGLVVLNIFLLPPSVVSILFPLPGNSAITLLFMLCYVLYLLKLRSVTFLPNVINWCCAVQIAGWLFLCVYHADSSYITRITYLAATYIGLVCLRNIAGGFLTFVKMYDTVILLMCIGGCLTFFGVFLFNMQPIRLYENLDTRTGYFFGLSCTNMLIGNIIRYSGFFDEPGAIAAWGMVALLYNRLVYKNIKFENILIIALVFTFSFAYYIQLFFFLILFRIKKLSVIIALSGVVLIGVIGLNSLKDTEYHAVYKLTVGRTEKTDAGTFAGDNRSNLMENALKVFNQHKLLGLGATNSMNANDYFGDNPVTPFAIDGIIGGLILYLPLLIMMMNAKTKTLKYVIIILVIGYLQRPFSCFFIYFISIYLFEVLFIDKKQFSLEGSAPRVKAI